MKSRSESRLKRKTRVRGKIFGTLARLRLSFYKSNKHLFTQVVDDEKSVTIVSASDTEFLKNNKSVKKNSDIYFGTGELIAKKATAKKIKKVVFDRGGFKFHGLLTKFVEGARAGGLEF